MIQHPIIAVDSDIVNDADFIRLLKAHELELPEPLKAGKYPTSEELKQALLSLNDYDIRVEQREYLFIVIDGKEEAETYFVLIGSVRQDSRISFYFQGGSIDQHREILQHIANAFQGTYLWLVDTPDQKPILITPNTKSES